MADEQMFEVCEAPPGTCDRPAAGRWWWSRERMAIHPWHGARLCILDLALLELAALKLGATHRDYYIESLIQEELPFG